MLAVFVGSEGQTVFSVEFNLALLDEINLLCKVSFPVDHVVFVYFYLAKKLDQSPHEVVVLTLPQKLNGVQKALVLVNEYFVSEGYR